MSAIRVVWGAATGPTAIASYDAALYAAGVGDFNLDTVSSVIPAGAEIEAVGTAPDLGDVGDRLTVVEARATGREGRVTAGLGWTRTRDGPGVLYEAAGDVTEAGARREIERGLAAARDLRGWPAADVNADVRTANATAGADEYATAVVLAAYGEGEPIL